MKNTIARSRFRKCASRLIEMRLPPGAQTIDTLQRVFDEPHSRRSPRNEPLSYIIWTLQLSLELKLHSGFA